MPDQVGHALLIAHGDGLRQIRHHATQRWSDEAIPAPTLGLCIRRCSNIPTLEHALIHSPENYWSFPRGTGARRDTQRPLPYSDSSHLPIARPATGNASMKRVSLKAHSCHAHAHQPLSRRLQGNASIKRVILKAHSYHAHAHQPLSRRLQGSEAGSECQWVV